MSPDMHPESQTLSEVHILMSDKGTKQKVLARI